MLVCVSYGLCVLVHVCGLCVFGCVLCFVVMSHSIYKHVWYVCALFVFVFVVYMSEYSLCSCCVRVWLLCAFVCCCCVSCLLVFDYVMRICCVCVGLIVFVIYIYSVIGVVFVCVLVCALYWLLCI